LNADQAEAARTRAAREEAIFAVSALTGEGLDCFLDAVTETIGEEKHSESLTLPFEQGRKRAWLFEKGLVAEETQSEDGYHLTLLWSARDKARFGLL
jgi:GTP-binding protein HflX